MASVVALTFACPSLTTALIFVVLLDCLTKKALVEAKEVTERNNYFATCALAHTMVDGKIDGKLKVDNDGNSLGSDPKTSLGHVENLAKERSPILVANFDGEFTF